MSNTSGPCRPSPGGPGKPGNPREPTSPCHGEQQDLWAVSKNQSNYWTTRHLIPVISLPKQMQFHNQISPRVFGRFCLHSWQIISLTSVIYIRTAGLGLKHVALIQQRVKFPLLS